LAEKSSGLERELKDWFHDSERIAIAGIGNPIRKDDYVGMKIVEDLQGKLSSKVYLLECETVPESYLQEIVDFNPTHVLLIDAALLGLKPGETRLLSQKEIENFPPISTHTLPLRIFCEYIVATTKSKIALLLIQPEDVEFGEGMSSEVEKSGKKIAQILLKLFA
jgi:hydrogenase 3 maturation protease